MEFSYWIDPKIDQKLKAQCWDEFIELARGEPLMGMVALICDEKACDKLGYKKGVSDA